MSRLVRHASECVLSGAALGSLAPRQGGKEWAKLSLFGLPPTLFEGRPLPPDVLPPGFAFTFFLTLILVRIVGGPFVYYLARSRSSGNEVWWGLLGTAVPVIAIVLLFIRHGPKAKAAEKPWNPWVICPFCRTPRGNSSLPCPGCGQALPPLPPAPAAPAADAAPSRAKEIGGSQVLGALLFTVLLANLAALVLIAPVLWNANPATVQFEIDALSRAPWFILAGLLIQDAILTALALDQGLFRGRLTLQEMGLSRKRSPFSLPRQIGLGVGAGAFTFVVSTTSLIVLYRALSLAGYAPEGVRSPVQPAVGTLEEYGLWLAAIVVLAPVTEEVFFRGYALGGFVKRLNVNRGILVSSVLFAAVHLDAIAFFPLLAGGVVLGTLFVQTGSLAAPIIAHATNNFIALTLEYLRI